ncbi:MAG TPA: sulfatase-like hydrolase/transferase [Gemmatimonadaceae bacterium]
MTPTPDTTRPGAAGVLLAGIAWGSLAALGQVARIFRRSYINGEFAWSSRDVYWMMPLANALYFSLAAILIWSILRLTRGGASSPAVSGTLAGLCVFASLLPFGGIHEYAVLVLAIGVGLQWARWMRKGHRRLERLAHVGGLTAGALLLIGGLIERGTRERRGAPALSVSAAPDSPNVLVIIWDTVRAASLSLYGSERPTTPELTRLAATSTTYDWAIAPAPWTLPSHCSMFTGLQHGEHGCGWESALSHGPTTLAEVFARNGYRTGGFVANRFYASHETGLQRGFVTYDDFPATLRQVLLSSSLAQMAIVRELATGVGIANKTHSLRRFKLRGGDKPLVDRKRAPSVTDEFLTWQARSPEPFFAFLNYFDAHDPYDPPEPWRTRFSTDPDRLARYEGGIAYLDDELGRLTRELSRRGLLDNTIVVVTSDHGEMHGEHGLSFHGNALYLPLLHVPLVIRFPERLPQGVRVARPAPLRDLARTLTQLAGLPDTMPGVSFGSSAWWAEPVPSDPQLDRLVLSETQKLRDFIGLGPAGKGPMHGLVDDRYHYIRNADGIEELYDYRTDRAEEVNLAQTPDGAIRSARYRLLLPAMTRSLVK